MIKSFITEIEITNSREIHITLPADVPVGPATLSVEISTQENKRGKTLGDLLRSEFFGMWQDRTDIENGIIFAHQLRENAWKRTQS